MCRSVKLHACNRQLSLAGDQMKLLMILLSFRLRQQKFKYFSTGRKKNKDKVINKINKSSKCSFNLQK